MKRQKRKIYSELRELPEEKFDKIPYEEIRKSIGWLEPVDNEWFVNMADGSEFVCKKQEIAQIIASLEEIKALLLRKKKNE